MIFLYTNAIISGLLLTSLFPKYNFWFLSVIALVPYLTTLIFKRDKLKFYHVFLSAFLLGAVWHLSSLWWFSYVSIIAMFSLSLLIAFLFAVTITIGWKLTVKSVPCWLAFCAVWMVFETITTYFLTGFPWLLLGYSWRKWLVMIQVSDLAGPYAVSFLIVLFNVSIAQIITAKLKKGKINIAPLVTALFLAIIFYFYGTITIHKLNNESAVKKIFIACVQANIPSLIKHDSSKNADILKKYSRLSIIASKRKPDLIIWPETAFPGYFFDKGLTYKSVTNLVKYVDTPLMSGLCRRDISTDYYLNYYNSTALIEPSGSVIGLYDKMHLVMFGEYVPYADYLPFLKLVTPIEGSFSCGNAARTLALTINKTNTFKFGPLICFEDVFGYVARAMTRAGADILLNLTNDGWFHNSPEPYQHSSLAAFRTIETRRPLVRSTNSGITTYINRYGKTVTLLKKNGKSVQVSGVMHAEIPVYSSEKITLYTKFGDWFLIGWCVIAGGLVIGTIRRRSVIRDS